MPRPLPKPPFTIEAAMNKFIKKKNNNQQQQSQFSNGVTQPRRKKNHPAPPPPIPSRHSESAGGRQTPHLRSPMSAKRSPSEVDSSSLVNKLRQADTEREKLQSRLRESNDSGSNNFRGLKSDEEATLLESSDTDFLAQKKKRNAQVGYYDAFS